MKNSYTKITYTVAFLGTFLTLLPIGSAAEEPPALAEAAEDDSFDMGPPTTPEQVARSMKNLPRLPNGPFEPTWESIEENYETPEWYRDGKFGIFIHWGLYSVPAYHNEWYQKYIYGNEGMRKWHIETYGPLDRFGYLDFADQFATRFDPEAWADLFAESGATYVIPTAEHHDGYSLWDSQVNPWNSAEIGPKRDLMAELSDAVRREGLKFGVSNHSIEHFPFIQPIDDDTPTDLYRSDRAAFYAVADRSPRQLETFFEDWVLKNYELIDQYQPDILWFDNGINHRAYDALKLNVAAYYYNRADDWGKQVSISTKKRAYLAGTIKDYERQHRAPTEITDYVWHPDDPIGPTFGYTTEKRGHGDRRIDMEVGKAEDYISRLIENVCRNGNYTLNISPRGDGTIPENQQAVLRQIGDWLKVNGDAIYGTRPWRVLGEGNLKLESGQSYSSSDFRFTSKGAHVYALGLAKPDPVIRITELGSTPSSRPPVLTVELLGYDRPLRFQETPGALLIEMPANLAIAAPYALRIRRANTN